LQSDTWTKWLDIAIIVSVEAYFMNTMEQDDFQKGLLRHTEDFRKVLETPSGDWAVKGFIDVAKNIYTISIDTKVVSKIIN